MDSLQYIRQLKTEDRWIFGLVVVSMAMHIVFLSVDKGWFGVYHRPVLEEMSIEADLFVGDLTTGAEKSALPNAEKAEEMAVPQNMLPQLSKTIQVEERSKEESPELVESTKKDDHVQSEKNFEQKKDELITLPKTNDDANKITQEDALRRLAIERLKTLEKTSKKFQAEQKSAIAKLKQDVAATGGSQGNLGGDYRNVYVGKLRSHIKPCYALPTGYQVQSANMKVGIAIVVAENGSLVSAQVTEPSGDRVFDELAFKAIQNCSPLPAPPKSLAGLAILSYFKP